MKRIFIIMLASLSLGVFAQDYKTNIQLNAGMSLVGRIFETVDDFGGDINTYSTPAFQLNIDRKIVNWFSIGVAGSFQMMGADYTDYEHYDWETGNETTESFENDVTRMNIAIRTLFHYGGGENVSFYSGMRFGITKWTVESSSEVDSYEAVSSIGGDLTNPGIQVVLFGVQGYFNEQIGINTEICLGSPHYFSMGLSYRL